MTDKFPFQITIARQLGSGGSELGRRLAQRMGYAYIDRQILCQAAEELGMSEAELSHREERIRSFWAGVVAEFSTGGPEFIMNRFSPQKVSDEQVIDAKERVLLRLAASGSCVFIGRCGFHVLAGKAKSLNLFIWAPRAVRIKRLIEFYGVDTATDAEKMLEESDRNRQRYVEKIVETLWYDARNYHLSIDMSLVTIDTAEDVVVSIANQIRPPIERKQNAKGF